MSIYRQSGVIPYRVSQDQVELLLITSMRRGCWIIPKGVIEPQLTPAASACQEAWEEAGVVGLVDDVPLGSYQYRKWGGTCTVQVFLLHVQTLHERWPEQFHRRRQWMTVSAAAEAVEEPGLRELILRVPTRLVSQGKE